MNTEDKIKELLNECPINKAHLTEDELSTYHQGLRCGAYNMAEWKDKQFAEERKKLLGLVKILKVDETNQTIIEDLKAMLQ